MIAGRNSCHHYNDFTAGGQTDPDVGRLIVGDCQPSGSGATGVRPPLPLYVGPDFGQDGVRVTAGASIQITGTTISSNLVHGANAPIGSVFAPTPNNDPFALGNHAENNQNLRLGAGVRLVGAAASSVTQSNVTDNAFGVLNTTLNGLANNTATPVVAQNDYWGLRVGSSSAPIPLPTPGPAVWPNTATPGSTFNPPIPENPVNGSPVADASCPAGVMDSDSVTFCPYRSSTQSDTVGGEWPIPEAPIAQTDPPNCTTGSVQLDPNIPTYDSFFGTVLGGPNAGDGLSGATPSAKKTAQLSAYMQAVADAVNANPGTTGQRVAVKLYQSGTSVLGVPFHVIVVGTPDNIANLDAGRNDAAFWRGVIDGTTSQTSALAAVDTRPAFGWITGTPHGNEPAGGEGSTKELYELVARTDCANSQRLHNLDVFIQPVTAPDDRDHNVRTLAWALDPNRDRGVAAMPENRALLTSTATYPGLFFIDAHQQSSGYFFPPNEDAALNEISHFALDLINDVIGPGIQQSFNDQSGQYRNYNTYDLFVPEYGDTVPALIMGSAGMTYEKGTNESYGKQVYDHYLAMDTTVNEVASRKADLLKKWIAQWPEAVQQGQDCKQQGNSQVSPVAIDVLDDVGSTMDQDPNTPVCGYFFLPDAHSGDVATTLKDLQSVRRPGLQAELGRDGAGRAPVRQLQPERARPARAADVHVDGDAAGLPGAAGRVAVTGAHGRDDAPGGNALRPAEPGQQALDPGGARGEPVPALPVLLRPGDLVVLDAAGLQRKRLPHPAAARRDVDEPRGRPERDDAGPRGVAGVRVQHGLDVGPLDGEPAAQPGSDGVPRSRGVRRGRHALHDRCRARRRDVDPARDAERGLGAVGHPGLRARLVPGEPLRAPAPEDRHLHRCHDGADQPDLPRDRRRAVHVDGLLRGAVRPEREGEDPGLPARADHLHRPRRRRARQPGLHGVREPGLDDRGGRRRDGAAELRQRRRDLHRLHGGRHHERPQRGDHAAQHVDASAGSAPRARRSTASSRPRPRPAGASTPAAGSTARRAATRRSTRRRWSATGRRSRPRPRS